MKIVIEADAEEVAHLLKEIVVGVTRESEERILKMVKRAEDAATATEVRLEAARVR